MADLMTTTFTHTYAGKEMIKEIFYKPQENVPAIEGLYRMMNVVDKANVYIANPLSKILRSYTSCGFSATGGVTTLVDRTISTTKIKANLSECVDTFANTIFSEGMRTGVDVNDMSNTQIDTIIKTQLVKATNSDIHRIVWFADAGDADNDWKQFDGYISLFLASSATIGASCFVDANSTAFESTDTLATDGALGLMKQLWKAAAPAVMATQGKKFYVTNTVYNNLIETYEDTQSGVGLNRLIDGVQTTSFRGVPVVAVPEWDKNLADTTNPHYTGSGLSIGSNLIVLTTPENLIVASDVNAPSNEFKFRNNDDDSEKLKIIAKFKLGVQFVHESLVCLAY